MSGSCEKNGIHVSKVFLQLDSVFRVCFGSLDPVVGKWMVVVTKGATLVSLYSIIRDFGESQKKGKWFNIWSNFFVVMTCICVKLVSVVHVNQYKKLH